MKVLAAVAVLLAAGAFAQSWQEITVEGFTLRWATVSGGNLSVELNAPTTGWVAVGFDPSQMMKDANIIIGYVSSGTPSIRDDFGVQFTSHAADTGLGGTDDVTVDGGFETGGSTEIHFTIPLNSMDMYDKELVPGSSYGIILARGANGQDDFTSPHAVVTTATILIEEEMAMSPGTWGSLKTGL